MGYMHRMFLIKRRGKIAKRFMEVSLGTFDDGKPILTAGCSSRYHGSVRSSFLSYVVAAPVTSFPTLNLAQTVLPSLISKSADMMYCDTLK